MITQDIPASIEYCCLYQWSNQYSLFTLDIKPLPNKEYVWLLVTRTTKDGTKHFNQTMHIGLAKNIASYAPLIKTVFDVQLKIELLLLQTAPWTEDDRKWYDIYSKQVAGFTNPPSSIRAKAAEPWQFDRFWTKDRVLERHPTRELA